MKPLTALLVPAHGAVSFSVGARHLMLMSPPKMLAQGDNASLTLTFKTAGTVTLSVPVTAATGPSDDPMATASMSGMPGMGG